MNFLEEIKSKKNAIIVLAIIISMVLTTTIVSATVTAAAASADCWDVKLGNKVVAVVKSQEEANSIINGVKNYYVSKGAKDVTTKVTPALTASAHSYADSDKKPKITTDVKSVVEHLIAGDVKEKTYTVQDGDTMWDIAEDKGISVIQLADMNKHLDWENILPGDKIKYYETTPLLKVTVDEVVTSEQNVPYETAVETDDSMYEDEENVKTEGKDGVAKVTQHIVSVDGVPQTTETIKSKTITEPVNKVVVKGTKSRPYAVSSNSSGGSSRSYSGPTYSGSGSQIASYACQFVGNPYVYGGTSLTNGADCSGFVYRVFNNCGYSIPRTGQSGCGRSVPLSQARAGDILIYPGHVSLCIGGGREVHACNESVGIITSNIGYVGPVLDVRRVVE